MTGDKKSAYQDIYRELYRLIYIYCFGRTDRDQDAAEDVTQNVFMMLWLKFDGLLADPKTNYKLWLLRVADLKLKEYYRDKKKRRRTSYDLDAPESVEAARIEPDMVDEVLRQKVEENEERYREEILARLSAKERILYQQVYLDGVPYRDAAIVHGISEGALRVRVMRMRDHVKEIVKELCMNF